MNASAASTNDCSMASDCTMSSSRRLSERSAMTPAHAPSTSIGRNSHAATKPTATPLSVSLRTSSVSPTRVSQLPICETSWPGEEQPEVADAHRAEDVVRAADHAPLRLVADGTGVHLRIATSGATTRSMSSAAACKHASSSGVKPSSRAASHVVRRCRDSARWTRPVFGELDPGHAPIVVVDAPLREPRVDELGRDLRDRRRRHLLGGRELAEGERTVARDRDERRHHRGRQLGAVVLPQDAVQPCRRDPQMAGDLDRVGCGGLVVAFGSRSSDS